MKIVYFILFVSYHNIFETFINYCSKLRNYSPIILFISPGIVQIIWITNMFEINSYIPDK